MKKEKKQIVLNGSLLRPLSVGRGALLHAGGNIYHTSRVVAILEESEDYTDDTKLIGRIIKNRPVVGSNTIHPFFTSLSGLHN